MEDSTDSPSVNMIPFPTRTILDGGIIQTYVMRTYLNKAIKANNSTAIFSAPAELSSEITTCIYKF
jgi:hypothetical protein